VSQKSPIFNWPEDENGNPKALITTSVTEKIPTAPYANVDLFASVTKFVDNTVEGIREAQKEVEQGLEPKRDEIIEELEK
jgi:hypothetical protein